MSRQQLAAAPQGGVTSLWTASSAQGETPFRAAARVEVRAESIRHVVDPNEDDVRLTPYRTPVTPEVLTKPTKS